ncbi:16673_t:CDS:2, partial [Acaulospora colombiana]
LQRMLYGEEVTYLLYLPLTHLPEIRHANQQLGCDEFMMRATLQDGLWEVGGYEDCAAAELLPFTMKKIRTAKKKLGDLWHNAFE